MLISWVLAGNETEARTVIAGSPHDPMVKSISLDLERRGYIVYIIVSSTEEENVIQSENRIDIRALWLDLTTVCESHADLRRSILADPLDASIAI